MNGIVGFLIFLDCFFDGFDLGKILPKYDTNILYRPKGKNTYFSYS